jgi:pyruvate kinase
MLELVATVGPASLEYVRDLRTAGATAFRLNASHLDADQLGTHLVALAHACPDTPVVVDLQGAKMRIELTAARHVRAGERLCFGLAAPCDVTVPHHEFFGQTASGHTLSVDDGRVRFEVESTTRDRLFAVALADGDLLPRKGVNVEQHPVRLERLTSRDRAACAIAAARGVTTFAFSFMVDGREAAWLRDTVPGCRVIGKVEREEAAVRLAEIASDVDAVWICRGDLGAQLGVARMAEFVSTVAPGSLPVPVLMAGQVLEHLTHHEHPTRSEVCHLFDLASRGYAGIVLSDETAIGANPVHAVSVAAALLAACRSSRPFQSL